MKSKLGIQVILVLIAIGTFSCCKEEPETNLPRPEYFSCYVNGELFTTQWGTNCDPIKGIHADGQYGDTIYSNYVAIIGVNCPGGRIVGFRGHQFENITALEVPLDDSIYRLTASYSDVSSDIREAYTYDAIEGSFSYSEISLPYIVNNTPHNGYAKGTFEFTAVNSLNDTVHVTSGTFGVILK